MKRCPALLLLCLVACGKDNAASDAPLQEDAPVDFDAPVQPPQDSQSFDFSCAGDPAGTPTATITVSGTTVTNSGTSLTPAPGVSVTLLTNGDDSVLDTQTSDDQGNFTFAAQDTGSNALDVYIKGASEGKLDAYLFPADPLVADISNVPVPNIDEATLNMIGQLGDPYDPSKSVIVLQLQDCSAIGVAGATVTVEQGGTELDINAIDLGSLFAQAAGIYFIENVPEGTTTIKATIGGHDFKAHAVKTFGHSTTSTQTHP